METCKNCNGVGLMSTGADPLNLSHGDKLVCKSCLGSGKVSSDASSTDAVSPKVEGTDQESDTGVGSGTASADGVKAPEVGDPCQMDDESMGVLSKDDQGAWVCVPKQTEA